jgi:ABC-type transport system involved in multi-copper enzyme maturation permease subunit
MPVFLRWLLRLGPANPIAVRLVQNGSRRSRHMYIRSAYLALLVLVMLWALLVQTGGGGTASFRTLAEAGASTFTYVAYLQIFLICVLSPVFMAGAIAQEASPRTWEVLLTTPLGRLQIVLGNLLGRLFFVLALLFASLPLFALTQYFGGVPGASIFASYLVAAAAALLVGAIAIALAVSRIAGRRAGFTFYVAVVTYLGVTYGLDAWLRTRGMGVGPLGNGVTWLTGLNPFLALDALLNPTTYPSADRGTLSGPAAFMLEAPVRAWISLSGLLSVALIAASTLTVRTGGLAKRTMERKKLPWYRRMLGLSGGAITEDGQAFRPPRHVWHNPIAWREAAARNATLGRILARWSFIVLGLALAFVLVVAYDTSAITADDYRLALLVIVMVELAVTTLVAINMSATAISREREDGTLDLLLTTPVTPAEYLGGKLRGLVAYLLPMIAVPVGTMLLAGLHAAVGGVSQPDNAQVPAGPALSGLMVPVVLPEAGIILALSAAPFMALCVMIGLHWSLKSKGAIASVVGAVIVAGLVAAVVGGCGYNAGRSIPAVGPALLGISPFAAGLGLVQPVDAMYDTVVNGGGLLTARGGLLIGAAASAGAHLAAVWALNSQMVRRFDMTVRKLAGTA